MMDKKAFDTAKRRRLRGFVHAAFAALVAAVGGIMPLASNADDYQFIITGDPEAAASACASAAVSPGRALATGTLTARTTSTSLEARFRTWLASKGVSLRSDKWITGFKIIFR